MIQCHVWKCKKLLLLRVKIQSMAKQFYFIILLKILFPLTNLALSQRHDQWAPGRRMPWVCQESPLLGWWHPLKLQKGKSSGGQAAEVSVPGLNRFSIWSESSNGAPGYQVPEGPELFCNFKGILMEIAGNAERMLLFLWNFSGTQSKLQIHLVFLFF